MKSQRGVAIIIILYSIVIFLSLGVTFIGDAINKSRSLQGSKDAQLALSMANAGISYTMNYLGNLNHWDTPTRLVEQANYLYPPDAPPSSTIRVTLQRDPATPPYPAPASSIWYRLTLATADQLLPGTIAPGKRGSFEVYILLARRNGFDEFGNNPVTGSTDSIFGLNYVTLQSTGSARSENGSFTYATRVAEARVRRDIKYPTAYYQNWRAWDLPGNMPPGQYFGNPTKDDNMANAAGVGDNFKLDGIAMAAAGSPYANQTAGGINVFDLNGNPNDNSKFLGTTDITYTQQQQSALVPSGDTNAVFTGKTTRYGSNLLGFPKPFGAANDPQGKYAPTYMLKAYTTASANTTVSGAVRGTAFKVSSTNNGTVTLGGGTPRDVEFIDESASLPKDRNYRKPGLAFFDVTYNANGTVTVDKRGFYSQKSLPGFPVNINPSTLTSNVLYFHGGNVRVHNATGNSGGLRDNGLTLVVNQGEGFYSSGGSDITPPELTDAVRYNSYSNTSTDVKYFDKDGVVQTKGGSHQNSYADGNYVSVRWIGDYDTGYPDPSDPNYGRTIYTEMPRPKPPTGKKPAPAMPKYIGGKWWFPDPKLDRDHATDTATSGTDTYKDDSEEVYANATAYEFSEGNTTITGDTTYTDSQTGGNGMLLGIVTRNYILMNDFSANAKSADSEGYYSTKFRGMVVSTNHGVQWEGNTAANGLDPAGYSTNQLPSRSLNNQDQWLTNFDTGGAQWVGINSLLASKGKKWKLKVTGSMISPFIDVDSDVSNNGYAYQEIKADPSTPNGLPPAIPEWTFSSFRNLGYIAFYNVLSYTDKGSLKAK